jgi:exopolysaccharide production protein ExoQ
MRAKLLDVGLVTAALFLIYRSHSVTGMLTSSGALILAGFLWFHQKFQLASIVRVASLSIMVLLVLIVGVVAGHAFLSGFDRDITLTGRTIVWELLWRSILDRPILGFGYGVYWGTQTGAEYYFGDSWVPPDAHNGFLDALVGGGVGMLALIIYQTGILVNRGIGYVLAPPSTAGWFVVIVAGLIPIYNLVESIYWKDYSVPTVLFATALFVVSRKKSADHKSRTVYAPPIPFKT